jgi:hypothetical protein
VTLTGTASEIDVTNGTGDGANPTIGLADDPILPGTGGMIFPKGTTVERLSPGVEGAFRYNTQTGAFEGYTAAGWGTIQTGSGVASFSAGTTGLTPSTATIGAIVLGGTLISSNGGTGLASYTAGDTLYYAAGTALSKLAIGATSRIMTSSGSAPQWTDPATITVGTATSATTATNLAGGTANQIAVQSNVGTTTFITAPTVASTVLSWNGAAFTWIAAASGTVTAVTASAPLASSGGTTPDISLGTVTTANGGTGLTTYTAGDLLYYATGTALSKLGIGASTYILTSSGTAPQYTDPATITVGTATTAGSVANSVTFNSTGGASPGTTFNGSVARTIDYSSVGAPKADGTGASGTWGINISGNAATATSATSATTATTATNVAGGAAGSLVYQTASATTSTLALGTQGYVLRAGASAPEWAVIDGGTF